MQNEPTHLQEQQDNSDYLMTQLIPRENYSKHIEENLPIA